MAGNLHAEVTQVLDSAPDFRARGAKLFRDARAADDDRGVIAQQADDATQARIRRAVGARVNAGWRSAGDKTIMREGEENG